VSADTVLTVAGRDGADAPGELVAAWLAADLEATARVLESGVVQVRGSGHELDGRLRALLEESRFRGWHVDAVPRESASTPSPDLDVRRA
jgi:hypothetical protein